MWDIIISKWPCSDKRLKPCKPKTDTARTYANSAGPGEFILMGIYTVCYSAFGFWLTFLLVVEGLSTPEALL